MSKFSYVYLISKVNGYNLDEQDSNIHARIPAFT
jgi:hypothetical protein